VIPAASHREKTAGYPTGVGGVPLQLNAPIVRQIEYTPGGIVCFPAMSIEGVAIVKAPGLVKGYFFHFLSFFTVGLKMQVTCNVLIISGAVLKIVL
jgi:hypothetical protein